MRLNRLSYMLTDSVSPKSSRVMIMGIRKEITASAGLERATFDPKMLDQTYAYQLRNNGGFSHMGRRRDRSPGFDRRSFRTGFRWLDS